MLSLMFLFLVRKKILTLKKQLLNMNEAFYFYKQEKKFQSISQLSINISGLLCTVIIIIFFIITIKIGHVHRRSSFREVDQRLAAEIIVNRVDFILRLKPLPGFAIQQ